MVASLFGENGFNDDETDMSDRTTPQDEASRWDGRQKELNRGGGVPASQPDKNQEGMEARRLRHIPLSHGETQIYRRA
jgi:hypothetical protein